MPIACLQGCLLRHMLPSMPCSASHVLGLQEWTTEDLEEISPSVIPKATKVFVNGVWKGSRGPGSAVPGFGAAIILQMAAWQAPAGLPRRPQRSSPQLLPRCTWSCLLSGMSIPFAPQA